MSDNYGLTVEDVMGVYNVTRAYVYKMASKRHWRRYRDDDNRLHYVAQDVGDTLRGNKRCCA